MRKTFLILATTMVALATFGVGTASAGVDVEYGGICTLAVTPPGPYTPGQSGVTVSGSSFEPGLVTDVFFDTTVVADDVVVGNDGTFAVGVTIPADAAAGSNHSFSASCDGTSDGTASVEGIVILAAGIVPTFVTDPSTINCSGRLTGFVDGAQAASSVTFALQSSPARNLATSTASANGRATFASTLTVNASTPVGTYTIASTGTDADGEAFSLTSQVALTANNCNTTVVTSGRVGGGSVPRTGTDSGPLAAVGAGVLLVGGAFVLVSRRRRATLVAG